MYTHLTRILIVNTRNGGRALAKKASMDWIACSRYGHKPENQLASF
jgi:hypothetical protein